MNEVRKLLESRLSRAARAHRADARRGRGALQPPEPGRRPRNSCWSTRGTRRPSRTRWPLRKGVDPFLPVLVALYHDAGKFHDGGYHQDDVPEEEHAADWPQPCSPSSAWSAPISSRDRQRCAPCTTTGWPCAGACRIVQDADRLDKLGALGVGAFFTKATLRGRGLVDAIVQTLSRELTYALAAPRSMLTESGQDARAASRRRRPSPSSTICCATSRTLRHRRIRTPHARRGGRFPQPRRRSRADRWK